MFMIGPRSRHQRRQRVRDATDFYECMMIHSNYENIESPSVPVQGMHINVFSKVYCDRVYFLCAERFETGSGFHPQRHPRPNESRVPPPPRGGGVSPSPRGPRFASACRAAVVPFIGKTLLYILIACSLSERT